MLVSIRSAFADNFHSSWPTLPFVCLFFCFSTIDNLTVIGDPCVVALCECNDRGGDRANEVSPSPEIVDTHHLIHYTEFVVDHFSLISTHYIQMWTTVFFRKWDDTNVCLHFLCMAV